MRNYLERTIIITIMLSPFFGVGSSDGDSLAIVFSTAALIISAIIAAAATTTAGVMNANAADDAAADNEEYANMTFAEKKRAQGEAERQSRKSLKLQEDRLDTEKKFGEEDRKFRNDNIVRAEREKFANMLVDHSNRDINFRRAQKQLWGGK